MQADPDSSLARQLRRDVAGEVLFDAFSRGRYSTDASIYQIDPIGVVVAKTPADVEACIAAARTHGVALLPRGAGTSQCGQAVGEALIVDTSKYLNQVIYCDPDSRRVKVQPGIVLDQLNAFLEPFGLFFPVDVSPSNRATIGGMTGNNSCGSRSIRYGNMVHNVHAINAILADGTAAQFGQVPARVDPSLGGARYLRLIEQVRAVAGREADEIERRIPKLLRRVGGYNIDSISTDGHNMADLLVGSEGTLGFFTEIELELKELPQFRTLGVCHFPSFHGAMDATRHIVELDPSAVELVDRTLLDLAYDIDMFRPTLERFVKGRPESLLLVEFSGDDHADVVERLERLGELMADLGFPDGVAEARDLESQRAIWEVRKAGLNIVMSMKGEGKPVSFVEDCAVALEDLAEYTGRLNDIFSKHATSGTWYAHASVGTLHVRPILNLKLESEAKKMRAIAEECFAMVREYKGSHSGEHGDGLVRSEFHRQMFGTRITRAFENIKDAFDPDGLFNPGKIVRPPRMDDRALFRYRPGYRHIPLAEQLDWGEWGGFAAAVEMCNNNGACRKSDPDVMCPSYRVTRDEQHVTRGRANSLRLALSGQLGEGAFGSPDLYAAMELCVGCKACKRECPTGVDMTRMKTEFLYHYHQRHGLGMKERLVSWLPRYAPYVAKAAPLLNLRNRIPAIARLSERLLGFSARRTMPTWHASAFRRPATAHKDSRAPEVVLFVDTFSTWFEPAVAGSAARVLEALGYRVHLPYPENEARPACCGRTFLAGGQIDEARGEARRTLRILKPFLDRNLPVIGLEPSCLLTFKDEFPAMLPGVEARRLADACSLFETFIVSTAHPRPLRGRLQALDQGQVLIHGHCHQKAFGLVDAMNQALALIPKLEAANISSSCCGMAGAFGYDARHYDISVQMANLNLVPAIQATGKDVLLVANGTSCRHQIKDTTGRRAWHVAELLDQALRS